MPSIGSLVNQFRKEFKPDKVEDRNRLVEAFLALETLITGSGGASSSKTHYARVNKAALQTITNNTITALIFDTTTIQNGGLHSDTTQNTRLTAQRAGWYTMGGNVQWAAAGAGIRHIGVRINGATIIASTEVDPTGATIVDQAISTSYYLNVGDYAEIIVYQNSGGNLNVNQVANYSPEGFIGEH